MKCPCESNQNYKQCCEPYIKGSKNPLTAEALMRSRYTAYSEGNIKYIRETLAPETRKDFDEESAKAWATGSEWLGLKILSSKKGRENDSKGTVEFNVKYRAEGKVVEHHEVSQFRKEGDCWYFVDGEAHTHEEGHGHSESHSPIVREGPKVGRNDPCSCGSGKKFKKCCGAAS